MKILFLILLIFIVVGMPLIVVFESVKFEKLSENISIPIKEEFTPPVEEVKISLPITPVTKAEYTYKYQYLESENKLMGLGSKVPEIYFKLVCNEDEVCPINVGDKYKLSDFKGKKVILNFWATWCSPCQYEMPILQEFMDKNKDAIVLAIVMEDTKKNAEQYIKKNKLTIPIIYDANKIAGNYQIIGLPRTIFIDETGKVYRVKVGAFIDLNEMEFYYGGT